MPSYGLKPSERLFQRRREPADKPRPTFILSTHCKYGHRKTGYIPAGTRSRVCAECHRAYSLKYYYQKRDRCTSS